MKIKKLNKASDLEKLKVGTIIKGKLNLIDLKLDEAGEYPFFYQGPLLYYKKESFIGYYFLARHEGNILDCIIDDEEVTVDREGELVTKELDYIYCFGFSRCKILENDKFDKKYYTKADSILRRKGL